MVADPKKGTYILKRQEGWGNRCRVNAELSLHHPTQQEPAVRDLREALRWKRSERQAKDP